MSPPNGEVTLIGVGLPRTGTSSLKIAFEQLKGGKCYHMTSFIFEGGDYDLKHWTKAFEGKSTKKDWVEFLEDRGFNTAVDFPPAYFFKDLADSFPNAKIVLSTRDPSSWHESVKESVMRTQDILRSFPANIVIGMKPGMTERLELAHKLSTTPPEGFPLSMFGAIQGGKTESEKFFSRWLKEVQAYVPKDRLLLFNVREGWEPLCQFVKAPVPDIPFPRANDRATMAKTINKVRNIGWAIVLGTPIIGATLGFSVLYGLGLV